MKPGKTGEPEHRTIGRSVGITDLIAYRECPRRASYGVRRHVDQGIQDPALRTPEAGSRAASYGSAAHDALKAIEDGHDDAAAVQLAWNEWGHWLQPDDLTLLAADVESFHRRDFQRTRTVLAEDEIRVPLILQDGELAYFRGRIDRLYERLDRPGSFILVDYKSSRHAKSEAQVNGTPDDDGRVDPAALQLWAYDWAVHEYLPEIEDLVCIYDQLRYGQIPVRKSDRQREEIRAWLIAQMSSYFADQRWQEDGLLPPRHNEWCAWCPILESCPIVAELSEFALMKIAALSGEAIEGAGDLTRYSELYSTAKDAAKVIERFVKSMNEIAKGLPKEEREAVGFRVTQRRNDRFTAAGLAQLYERLGPERFLELVSLPKTRLQALDGEIAQWALSLMEPGAPTEIVTRR